MALFEMMSTYVRVVEAGSLSAAAKQLRISAAAVSRQLSSLESELHVELVTRTTRKMSVTQAGREYYERCVAILKDVEAAQAIGRSSPMHGILKISAPVTFGMTRVLPHLRSFMALHPEVTIDLRLEDPLVNLALEGLDVAIRVGVAPPDSTSVISQPLFSFRRVLVASPTYLKRRGTPKFVEALVNHSLLDGSPSNSADAWSLQREGVERTVRFVPAFRSNMVLALIELAAQGQGIAMVPDWFALEGMARGTLKAVLPEWQTKPVTVQALIRTTHRGVPRVRAFVDHLRAALAG